MYVARVLYPVEVLGPGKRVGIWFSGCPRRCRGCSNPELWEFHDRYAATPETVLRLVENIAQNYPVDGFTLTGGDPMFQPEALRLLLPGLREISRDILVYTGYKREELSPQQLEDIAVLIDGEYIESRNNNCILRGSDNQRIHVLDPAFTKRYEDYCNTAENRIQNFMTSDGVISVGIHKPDFMHELEENLARRGLNPDERP